MMTGDSHFFQLSLAQRLRISILNSNRGQQSLTRHTNHALLHQTSIRTSSSYAYYARALILPRGTKVRP